MLAINVSIPNATVAHLEQFRSPQLRFQRERESDEQTQGLTEKHHVVISRQSPFAANAVPKLVAMATSLRPSISAVFNGQLDPENLPLESNSESLAAIQPKLYRFKVYLPHPTHQGDSRFLRWGGETPTMFGMDVLT